ncbi:hypothetical protein OG618_37940 (plasmid) [Kitasatospora sp. NBC_01246]|uniref:hypothetical protein n=1 Tax=Kitasatospora sp. NBC_01246 TaxID=2903570 RepID=UPI002E30ECDE|nr:hypothetical protein [Kitasatospora sp. NBC_01246]
MDGLPQGLAARQRNADDALPSVAETDLVAFLRRLPHRPPEPGWRYGSMARLLLDVGRLFTPAPWPGGSAPGSPGACYSESAILAEAEGWAYVEGFGWDRRWFETEHAWCAAPGQADALDPTWTPPADAYLGVPLDPRAAANLMHRHQRPLLSAEPVALEWLQDGVPEGLLVDCGRPVPAEGAAR